MKPEYIGNIRTKCLHAVNFIDGRCKIDMIREEYKVAFSTMDEALAYPERGKPIFHQCGFCFKNMERRKKE
ncbi:MAG: hypothetical protein U0M21_08785 [Emergencia sp.]|nr:hypothetical protein [Emergencia sp.]